MSAVYLGPGRTLNVVSRSKITLRRFEHEKLQRYADRLGASPELVVADLGKKGIVDKVLLSFYVVHDRGPSMAIDIYDSCAPSRGYFASASVPLCLIERRQTNKWTPW